MRLRDSEPCCLEGRSALRAARGDDAGAELSTGSHHRNNMSTIPVTEAVPRISQQLTLLVYELLDAHHDTARLGRRLDARRALGGAPVLFARSPAPGTRGAGAQRYPDATRRHRRTDRRRRSRRRPRAVLATAACRLRLGPTAPVAPRPPAGPCTFTSCRGVPRASSSWLSVLELVAERKRNRQIGEELSISNRRRASKYRPPAKLDVADARIDRRRRSGRRPTFGGRCQGIHPMCGARDERTMAAIPRSEDLT